MAKNLQTVARRALTPCSGMEAFRFADGTMARDLTGLRQVIGAKSAHLIAHHRREYHPWIERVLGDPALARKLERLALRGPTDPETYRAEVVAALDERIGKLRLRVV